MSRDECSFCIDKVNYLTDVRKLLCGHVACTTCLSQEVNTFGAIKCPTCRLEIKVADVGSLERVKMEPRKPTLSNAGLCDMCLDKSADVFCVTCQMALCSNHKEEDHNKADSGDVPAHYHVPIKLFLKNEETYKRHFCKVHQDRLTSQACVSCVQVFCTTCDPHLKCPVTESDHVLLSLPDAVKLIKSRIEDLQAALTDAIARFHSLEKETARKIKFIEKEEEQLIADVNKAVREQVDHIMQEGERLKAHISTYAGDIKKQAEDLRMQLMTSMEAAEEQTKGLASIKKVSLDGLLLERFSSVQHEVGLMTRRNFEPICIVSKHLTTKGRFRCLEVELADVPCSMEYVNTVRTGNDLYYSVRWMSADRLVTGSRDGIEIRDSKLSLINFIKLEQCLDVVPYRDQLVVLRLLTSESTKTIALYTQTLEKVKDVVGLPIKSKQLSQIAVADGKIMASEPDKKCVYVYTFNGELLQTVDVSGMANPRGIYITADESLLVTDWTVKGSVRKYQLRGDYSLMRESDQLLCPWAVVEANNGLIYVNSYRGNHNSIYQLSTEGKLLKVLTCDQLNKTKDTHNLSVVGDSLAVACREEGLKLFKFKYIQCFT